ncbi:MAG: NAD(P)-dependent oxidoreductase [Armatimonadetes bacterium]|nr:NAD(P)-dependent oxidoreductase [Armatimonadota bacterium]
MKVCVIGGTGHIGKHLTPMLVEEGHEVVVVSSGRTPMPEGGAWRDVQQVILKYGAEGWTDTMREIGAEVIVDILQGNSPDLYDAVQDSCEHFVVCGSVWMFGRPRVVPTPETTQDVCLFEGYARRYRQMQEVRERARADGKPFTAIMCPNICGPYKIPLDGRGGRSIEVHKAHQRGEPVVLPAPGNNLIGPCDAEDIASAFAGAIRNREAAADEIFNVGSAYALTAVQFVETYAEIYGTTIPVEMVSWEEFETNVLPDLGANWHFQANMCPDISLISRKIGYRPVYTPEQTMERAVRWMFDEGLMER